MKISASIYSDKKRPLAEVIEDLVEHQVDMFHVDCNDDPAVFEDIKYIKSVSNIPVDLHIITETPEKYYNLLREIPVEYVTFQFEDLKSELNIPSDITGRKGLAIITPTDVDVFDAYSDFDFILIMATIPGQSGGKFDPVNFAKIRSFRRKYPKKSIHVDGGVNGEVSFILRNMGVTSSVSGSYLFNAHSVGNALMNLTNREVESQFAVKDFMIPLEQSPIVKMEGIAVKGVLEAIEQGRMGFTLVTNREGTFKGLVSNADVLKALLKHLDDLNAVNAEEFINPSPLSIQEDATVYDMLKLIKESDFPVMYLPVLKKNGFAAGIVTFVNLVKGEL
ncbi:MAG: CBS domain-containing protein [Crocinitomicaceae bacterium]